MTYSVKWYKKPLKLLESLDKEDAERILDKLEEVALDPFRYLKNYEGEGHKLRVGDFRLIID
jgi:mRNA-degrading endonuclease RelE of RelBE toxin-antitoxin system